jgi:hypothetical protein
VDAAGGTDLLARLLALTRHQADSAPALDTAGTVAPVTPPGRVVTPLVGPRVVRVGPDDRTVAPGSTEPAAARLVAVLGADRTVRVGRDDRAVPVE